jgi:replication factor A1
LNFHYALVDDLLSREEFERRVEAKMEESGDLLDNETAAMLVVQECGRHHVKIRDLAPKPTLLSFFGKVMSTSPPREFTRADGSSGNVANLTVGDETGQVRLVLWDDKAAAVDEIDEGEVLEIIGKPIQSAVTGALEIHALALRKAICEISLSADVSKTADIRNEYVAERELRVIAIGEPRKFTRRDGSPGEMVEAVVGDASGTARLICWTPQMLGGIAPGCSICISGARGITRPEGSEYQLDENGTVKPLETAVCVPITPLSEIKEKGIYSVQAKVRSLEPARRFTSRQGEESWVRTVTLADGTGEVRLVLWGEKAEEQLMPGDQIEIYHVPARSGRKGTLELSAGRGSALILSREDAEAVCFEGTVINTPYGLSVDNGREYYLVHGDLPLGAEVRVCGTASRRRVHPDSAEMVVIRRDELAERARALLQQLTR